MPRKSTSIPDSEVTKAAMNAVYGETGESVSSIMARIAAAPIRNEVTEMDAVSVYPPEMTRHRRSVSIPEKRKVRHSDSPVPMRVSNRRTDDYLCGLLPRHSHPSPDWLIHPENYRCSECKRYCSEPFLLNGICGYCRGQF